MARYELNPHWSAVLTAKNLFDRKYYAPITENGVYGEPRNRVLLAMYTFCFQQQSQAMVWQMPMQLPGRCPRQAPSHFTDPIALSHAARGLPRPIVCTSWNMAKPHIATCPMPRFCFRQTGVPDDKASTRAVKAVIDDVELRCRH